MSTTVSYKIVEVEWEDACRYASYDMHGLVSLHTLGYLVKEDEHCVSIAQELNYKTGQYRDSVSISRVAIKNIREYRKR